MYPAQKLNQVQLIEEVVFEPEDKLVVGIIALDDLSPCLEAFHGIDARVLGRSAEEARAHFQERIVGQIARNRAVMKGIGPDRQQSRNAGLGNRSRCAAAIGDMQEARYHSSGYYSSPLEDHDHGKR